MTTISPTLSKRRNHLLFFTLLAGHLLLISAQVTTGQGQSVLRAGLLGVLAPLARAGSATLGAVRSVWDSYIDLRGVHEENRRLQEKLARLEQALWMEREAVASHDRMSQVLELAKRLPFESVVAEVIGFDASAWHRSLTVNRGSAQGVELNAPVIGPGGLVGRVIAVGPQAARVQLFSDRSSAVGALLVRSRARGIVSGAGEARLQMKYVSNLEDVAIGDLVVTSGMDGIYPKGMAVGRVESAKNGAGLFKVISVEPASAVERLEEVFILKRAAGVPVFTVKIE